MTDVVFAKALKRRGELEKELEEIDQFLRLYRRYSEETPQEQAEFKIGPGLRITAHRNGIPEALFPQKGQTLSPSGYAKLAEDEIRIAQRPLTRGELAEALIKRGVAFPTDDVPRYLGTILWRNKERFPNVPGLGYAVPEIMRPEYKQRISDARSAVIDKEAMAALQSVADEEIKRLRSLGHRLDAWEANSIPRDIDARLLTLAGDALGRDLYEPEKRYLRETFSLQAIF